MNANQNNSPAIGKAWVVAPFVTLALAMATVACMSKPSPKPAASTPVDGTLRPAALRTAAPAHPAAVKVVVDDTPEKKEKPSPNKLLTYRSRDYGVSFQYPWQYTIMGGRAVANADSALHPVSDGYEGQVTLARVDVPRGYYADTNFDNGYFMLSLNPSVGQQECESQLGLGKDGKVLTENLNGVDFRWRESETGGHGQSSKVRQYVTFANDTCYELELGVKTSNADGLAREVNPDQVMRRLDTILRTIVIQAQEKPADEVKTSTAVEPPVPRD